MTALIFEKEERKNIQGSIQNEFTTVLWDNDDILPNKQFLTIMVFSPFCYFVTFYRSVFCST
jgi:hypothetical protein